MAYIVNVTNTDEVTAATYTVSLGSHATGDLLLVCLSQDGGGTAITQSGGSDWTFLGTQASSGGARQAWCYKIATSGSETNPTFAGANDEWVGTCLVIRDAHATEPFGATPTSGTDFVRVDYNNVAYSDSGSLTTAVDDCLLIYSWNSDGGALRYMRTELNELTGIAINLGTSATVAPQIIGARQQYTAGAAPTVRMHHYQSIEGGNGWLLAVRNKTGGILQPTIETDIDEIMWYGNWPNKGNSSITVQAPDQFAATINGITCSSITGTAANALFADTDIPGIDVASTESGVVRWVGFAHTISSTDLSGGLVKFCWYASSGSSSVLIASEGFIAGFKDSSGNWATYQIASKKKGWAAAVTDVAYIDLATATPYATSGTLDYTDVTQVAFLYHRSGSSTTSYSVRPARLSLVKSIKMYGGGAAFPVTIDTYHTGMHLWPEFGFSLLQGAAQYLLNVPLQIGDGTHETYYEGSATSVEFPVGWSATMVSPWQMKWNVGANKAGFTVKASADDTIRFKNGLAVTDTEQLLRLDAATNASASYDFAQTFSGFAVGWNTSIPLDSAVFFGCRDVDLKGATVTGCRWNGSQAADAACLLSVDGASITDSTFIKGSEDYAIEISAAGDYVLEGNTYTGYTKEIYVSASSGTVTITILSSDAVPDYDTDGATVVIDQPYTSQANITNLEAGSRVYIYNVTAATEIYNDVVAGTSYSQGYNEGTDYTDGDVVEVRIAWSSGASAKLPVSYFTVASATGWAVLAQQTDDDVYNTNAIDGDTVTEFVADYPNVQIDIDDPDGVTTVQRGYAWYISGQMTEDGIRYYHGAMTAEDPYNYRINVSVADMRIQNISTDPVQVLGGRLYRSDGTRVTESGSGPIEMEYGRAYIASGSGTCPTASENAAAVWADPRALTLQKFMALK